MKAVLGQTAALHIPSGSMIPVTARVAHLAAVGAILLASWLLADRGVRSQMAKTRRLQQRSSPAAQDRRVMFFWEVGLQTYDCQSDTVTVDRSAFQNSPLRSAETFAALGLLPP